MRQRQNITRKPIKNAPTEQPTAIPTALPVDKAMVEMGGKRCFVSGEQAEIR